MSGDEDMNDYLRTARTLGSPTRKQKRRGRRRLSAALGAATTGALASAATQVSAATKVGTAATVGAALTTSGFAKGLALLVFVGGGIATVAQVAGTPEESSRAPASVASGTPSERGELSAPDRPLTLADIPGQEPGASPDANLPADPARAVAESPSPQPVLDTPREQVLREPAPGATQPAPNDDVVPVVAPHADWAEDVQPELPTLELPRPQAQHAREVELLRLAVRRYRHRDWRGTRAVAREYRSIAEGSMFRQEIEFMDAMAACAEGLSDPASQFLRRFPSGHRSDELRASMTRCR